MCSSKTSPRLNPKELFGIVISFLISFALWGATSLAMLILAYLGGRSEIAVIAKIGRLAVDVIVLMAGILLVFSLSGFALKVTGWKKDSAWLTLYGLSFSALANDILDSLYISCFVIFFPPAFGWVGLVVVIVVLLVSMIMRKASQTKIEKRRAEFYEEFPDEKRFSDYISLSQVIRNALKSLAIPMLSLIGLFAVKILAEYFPPQILTEPFSLATEVLSVAILTTIVFWVTSFIALLSYWKADDGGGVLCTTLATMAVNVVLLLFDFVAAIITFTALFGWPGTLLAAIFSIICGTRVVKRARHIIAAVFSKKKAENENMG